MCIAEPGFSTNATGSTHDAGGWGTQTLIVEGLNDGVSLYSAALFVTLTPTVFSPNWAGIDQLRISTGTDFNPFPNLAGNGQQRALDNLTISMPGATTATPISEPAIISLLGLGVAGIGLSRRKIRYCLPKNG